MSDCINDIDKIFINVSDNTLKKLSNFREKYDYNNSQKTFTTVLKKYIKHRLAPVKIIPDKLYGLLNIEEWKSNDKHIYLMYDLHLYNEDKDNRQVINLFDFLKANLENNYKFIDIYIENFTGISPSDRYYYEPEKTLLGKVRTYLHDCGILSIKNKKCENNIRVHNIDVRNKYATYFIPDYETQHYLFTRYNYERKFESYEYDYKKYIIMELPILYKQLEKCDKQVSALLYKRLEDRFKGINWSKFLLLNWTDENVFNKKCKKYLEHISRIELMLMDAYCIARIFRNFKNVRGTYSDSPKNIIIYAGARHCDKYKNIFKELNLQNIFTSNNNLKISSVTRLELQEQQIQDISGMRLPFFIKDDKIQTLRK